MNSSASVAESRRAVSQLALQSLGEPLKDLETAITVISGSLRQVNIAFGSTKDLDTLRERLIQEWEGSAKDDASSVTKYLTGFASLGQDFQVVVRMLTKGRIQEALGNPEEVANLVKNVAKIAKHVKMCWYKGTQIRSEWEKFATHLPPRPQRLPPTPPQPLHTPQVLTTPVLPRYLQQMPSMQINNRQGPSIFSKGYRTAASFLSTLQISTSSEAASVETQSPQVSLQPKGEQQPKEGTNRVLQPQVSRAEVEKVMRDLMVKRQAPVYDEEFDREMDSMQHPDGHAAASLISKEFERYCSSLEKQVLIWDKFVTNCRKGKLGLGPEDAEAMESVCFSVEIAESKIYYALNILKADW